jgi:acetyl-CoA carboxylase carboxyl transferase subunit beta
MSWLTNFVRPKIRALVKKPDTPDNLWDKCPACGQMIFHRELEANQRVLHPLRPSSADRREAPARAPVR